MLLLGLPHRHQTDADCLAACAAMVLEYLGISVAYSRLLRLLGTTSDGTVFSNLVRLEGLGILVRTGIYGDVTMFEQYLELGLPIIVGVQTLHWEHWQGLVTQHAVVVVGIDQEQGTIYIHDPFFGDAPLEMSLIDFEVGWIERDQQYAVIGLAAL